MSAETPVTPAIPTTTTEHWTEGVPRTAVDALLRPGGLAVVPTKVG